jgi:hypothetical protein
MGFLIRRAAIRLAFGGAGALGAGLRGWRMALAPQPVKVRIPVRRRPR